MEKITKKKNKLSKKNELNVIGIDKSNLTQSAQRMDNKISQFKKKMSVENHTRTNFYKIMKNDPISFN